MRRFTSALVGVVGRSSARKHVPIFSRPDVFGPRRWSHSLALATPATTTTTTGTTTTSGSNAAPASGSRTGGKTVAATGGRGGAAAAVAGGAATSPKPRLLRRLNQRDFDACDTVYESYMQYFNHIRFRQGWSQPAFTKEQLEAPFREAAEYTVRIRKMLDEASAGEPKLRKLDGESQGYLHSPAALADFTAGTAIPSTDATAVVNDHVVHKFVREIVHHTFRDARGYVEGLKKEQVDKLLDALVEHRYNPKAHLGHLLQESKTLLEGLRVHGMGVTQGSEEDALWREAISKYYNAIDAFVAIEECQKKLLATAADTSSGSSSQPK